MRPRSVGVIFVLGVCLIAQPATAAESDVAALLATTSTFAVVVLPVHRTLVPNAQELLEPCGVKVTIDGCTRFAARRLDCVCELAGDRWRMRARAQYLPAMYLTRLDLTLHENRHLADVRDAVADHLSGITAERFESASDCEAAARSAVAGFLTQMDEFSRLSNCRLHPSFAATQGMCGGRPPARIPPRGLVASGH